MHIGPLPAALRDIRDDGRSNQEILAGLRTRNVAIFVDNEFFEDGANPVPESSTLYNFLATVASLLPSDSRLSPAKVFEAVTLEHSGLRKVTLRSSLFLIERMIQQNLHATLFLFHEPRSAPSTEEQYFLTYGRVFEDGVSWIAYVGNDHVFEDDQSVIVFLDTAA